MLTPVEKILVYGSYIKIFMCSFLCVKEEHSTI